MSNREDVLKTMICRYLVDCQVREGERLPDAAHLAAVLRYDVGAIDLALEACCRDKILERSSEGNLVVRSLPKMPAQDSLSFRHSAEVHGNRVEQIFCNAELRGPKDDPDDPVATGFDKEAHQVLGLQKGEQFIVISRVRWLSSADDNVRDESMRSHPRAIHRAYLDPKRFSDNFLSKHDFKEESLIGIYNSEEYSYVIGKRESKIIARLACPAERFELQMQLGDPVLDMAQRTFATKEYGETPFVLEYLRATYWNLPFEFER